MYKELPQLHSWVELAWCLASLVFIGFVCLVGEIPRLRRKLVVILDDAAVGPEHFHDPRPQSDQSTEV